MLGWPGSDWSDAPEMTPPFEADWSRLPGEVRHTFTHFHLILTVWTATVPVVGHAPDAGFVPGAEFDARSLPTVMRKVWTLASVA